jgi:hypothetical protein
MRFGASLFVFATFCFCAIACTVVILRRPKGAEDLGASPGTSTQPLSSAECRSRFLRYRMNMQSP